VNLFYGEAAAWKVYNYQSSPQLFLPDYTLPENELAALSSSEIIDILVKIVQRTRGNSLSATNKNEKQGVYLITFLLGSHSGDFLCSATVECFSKVVAKEVTGSSLLKKRFPLYTGSSSNSMDSTKGTLKPASSQCQFRSQCQAPRSYQQMIFGPPFANESS